MGVDYNCYVGPYIQVHNPPVGSIDECHTCPNQKCRNHKHRMSEKFCPDCGQGIKLQGFPCLAPKDFDLYGECDERLYEAMSEYKPDKMKHEQFFLSNIRGTPGKNFDPKDECCVEDMTNVEIANEVTQFTTTLAPELTKIKAFFGADNVKVKWGVLSWAS
jgi:hypothetical protein